MFVILSSVSSGPDDSPPVLELSCPVSSPLPGDAPLEPPVLGIVAGGRRSPGRSYKRQRSSRSGSKSQGEDEAEVGETPSSQPEAVHEVTPLGTPPALPLVGVGRRTSVLFKKAKNGARMAKNRCPPQQNGKTNGLDSTPSSPNPPSILALPPTHNASPEALSPSSHHLRSKSHSSDNQVHKQSSPPGGGGKDSRSRLPKGDAPSAFMVPFVFHRPDEWTTHSHRAGGRRPNKVSLLLESHREAVWALRGLRCRAPPKDFLLFLCSSVMFCSSAQPCRQNYSAV